MTAPLVQQVEARVQPDGSVWVRADEYPRLLRELADAFANTPVEFLAAVDTVTAMVGVSSYLRHNADAFDCAVIESLSDG